MYRTNELRFVEIDGEKILQQLWKPGFDEQDEKSEFWQNVPLAGKLVKSCILGSPGKTGSYPSFTYYEIKADEFAKIRNERDQQVRISVCEEIKDKIDRLPRKNFDEYGLISFAVSKILKIINEVQFYQPVYKKWCKK